MNSNQIDNQTTSIIDLTQDNIMDVADTNVSLEQPLPKKSRPPKKVIYSTVRGVKDFFRG